jgi:hypothetical protein
MGVTRTQRARSRSTMITVLLGGILWMVLAELAAARSLPGVRVGHTAQGAGGEPFVQLGRGLRAEAPADYRFGGSVALSADGSTALVSAEHSARVFMRSGSAWTQQAALPDSGKVALSADGNTALIGGSASYVFTRSGPSWIEQATLSGGATSSALSADGNTVLMGNGAVFTRSGKSWSVTATLSAGEAVALSADGSTALIGSRERESTITKTIFARSGSSWTRQYEHTESGREPPYPEELTLATSASLSADGSTAVMGFAHFTGGASNLGYTYAIPLTRSGPTWTQGGALGGGASVSLSADGNTALIGEPDVCPRAGCLESPVGRAWTFTRSGTAWTRDEQLLACELGPGLEYGDAVALSADGRTALIGDPFHKKRGAAWIFQRGLPLPPPPVVTGVHPGHGPASGRLVRVMGSNLCNVSAVDFGGHEGAIHSYTPTAITVEAPEEEPGTVDVTVTTPSGTSAITELDHFTYRMERRPLRAGRAPRRPPT